MTRNRAHYRPYENNARAFKRPGEQDTFNMVWHILHPEDYIRSSSWTIDSRTESTPTLVEVVSFLNNTPLYRDRQGTSFDLPWRKSTAIILIGGTEGVDYQLTNEIITNSGRLLRRTSDLSCVERYPSVDRFEDTPRFQP